MEKLVQKNRSSFWNDRDLDDRYDFVVVGSLRRSTAPCKAVINPSILATISPPSRCTVFALLTLLLLLSSTSFAFVYRNVEQNVIELTIIDSPNTDSVPKKESIVSSNREPTINIFNCI